MGTRRGGSNVYQQSMFCENNKKNIKILAENFQILKLKKSLFIAWASFRNVMLPDFRHRWGLTSRNRGMANSFSV